MSQLDFQISETTEQMSFSPCFRYAFCFLYIRHALYYANRLCVLYVGRYAVTRLHISYLASLNILTKSKEIVVVVVYLKI